MKAVVVFIAGAMFLSRAIAGDPGFEGRFQMKTGRSTPAEQAPQASKPTSCEKHGCCSGKDQPAPTAAEAAAINRDGPGPTSCPLAPISGPSGGGVPAPAPHRQAALPAAEPVVLPGS